MRGDLRPLLQRVHPDDRELFEQHVDLHASELRSEAEVEGLEGIRFALIEHAPVVPDDEHMGRIARSVGMTHYACGIEQGRCRVRAVRLHALKRAGATQLLGFSAVGSLALDVAPGALALPEQYVDWTRGRRAHTFFGDGVAAHVSTARPVSPGLVTAVQAAAGRVGVAVQRGLTYACACSRMSVITP